MHRGGKPQSPDRFHSPATRAAAGTADRVRTGGATVGARPAVGTWRTSGLTSQSLRGGVPRMRRVRWAAPTVAEGPFPAPAPILAVKVPVNHAGQRKRFPGARLIARLWRLEATRAPAMRAVESDPAGRRYSTYSTGGPDWPACSCAAHNSADNISNNSRRHGRTTSTGGRGAAPGRAQSPVSCVSVIVCFVVPLAFKTATRTLVMSVGTVIISPIPTLRRPRKRENMALVGYISDNGQSMATSRRQSSSSRIFGGFFLKWTHWKKGGGLKTGSSQISTGTIFVTYRLKTKGWLNFRYYPNFFIVLSIQAVLQIYFSLERIIELNSSDNIVNILTCSLKSLQLLWMMTILVLNKWVLIKSRFVFYRSVLNTDI